MKYPFSPEILDAMPEKLAELFRSLEIKLLEDICSRLQISGQINEAAIQGIRSLREHGINLKDIEKAIAKTVGISKKELDKLLEEAVKRNESYYEDLIDKAGLTKPEYIVSDREVDIIRRQTDDEFTNLTRSLGFLVTQGSNKIMLPPAKAYQWALDNAEMHIMSGTINYNEAIRNAVKELADSGIRTVDYESGHMVQVDVAVRRAAMTGVSQLSDRYTEQAAVFIGTPLFEVSAHRGARDTGVGPANHKEWQGKVYSAQYNDPKYPNIYEVCGLGTGEGLEGWNCRHRRFPFVDGVSERAYTDEQLANIDPPPFEFEGKQYTAYEAMQKQREIERTIRKLKRERAAYKAAWLTDECQTVSVRIRRLNGKYKAFSKAAGLPMQMERMKVLYD